MLLPTAIYFLSVFDLPIEMGKWMIGWRGANGPRGRRIILLPTDHLLSLSDLPGRFVSGGGEGVGVVPVAAARRVEARERTTSVAGDRCLFDHFSWPLFAAG